MNKRDMKDGAPYVSGYNASELRYAKCQEELELGRAAEARKSQLLNGAKVYDCGKRDRYKRPLVWVKLPDGQSVKGVLMSEWTPKYRGEWC